MKVLSLFSGVGAFEKALDNLHIPYELVGFSEIDKYAVKSYCAIHGVDESMNLGDITKIDGERLPKDIDLLTYGFPCQDISIAGKQKGLIDEDGTKTRSGLFFEALRIIEETKPKVAIAENVKNLVGKKFNAQFQVVLSSLDEAGYNNYYAVLNAKDYGVPQNRERVFIVSIRKDIDRGLFQFPVPIALNKRLKDVLEEVVDEKYYLSGTAVEKLSRHNNKIIKSDTPEISNTIHAGYYKMGGRDQQYVRRVFVANDIKPCVRVNFEREKEQIAASNKDIYQCKCESGWQDNKIGINLSPTIRANNKDTFVLKNSYICRLTPRECFRLMGFDDESFCKAEAVNSNTQLYKQAGNSIVVDVLEELFCKMFDCRGRLQV